MEALLRRHSESEARGVGRNGGVFFDDSLLLGQGAEFAHEGRPNTIDEGDPRARALDALLRPALRGLPSAGAAAKIDRGFRGRFIREMDIRRRWQSPGEAGSFPHAPLQHHRGPPQVQHRPLHFDFVPRGILLDRLEIRHPCPRADRFRQMGDA